MPFVVSGVFSLANACHFPSCKYFSFTLTADEMLQGAKHYFYYACTTVGWYVMHDAILVFD